MNFRHHTQLGSSAAAIRHYPTATELALVTGVEFADNVVVKASAFHGEDLVLSSRTFWERARRYIHVYDNKVVVPALKAFSDDLLTVGQDDPEWQHGAERLINLIAVAATGGYKNICIAL